MELKERNVQYTGRKKLILVDQNNVPIEGKEELLVQILRDEGEEHEVGTLLDKETLENSNWRHHTSLSFKAKNNNTLPGAKVNETQIVTTSDDKTWLISPSGSEIELSKKGTIIRENGVIKDEWNADSKQNTLTSEQLAVLNKETNKQDALTTIQLENINAVPHKLNSNAQAVDSAKLDGKTESQLSVGNSAKLGGKIEIELSVGDSAKLGGKTESQLDVNSASTATFANAATLANMCAKLNGTDARDNIDWGAGWDTHSGGNTQPLPSAYYKYAIGFVSEFVKQLPMGLSDGIYGLLLTNVPWGDSTGGFPSQTLYSPTGKMFKRRATSNTSWGKWNLVYSAGEGGCQFKNNQESTNGWVGSVDSSGNLTFAYNANGL